MSQFQFDSWIPSILRKNVFGFQFFRRSKNQKYSDSERYLHQPILHVVLYWRASLNFGPNAIKIDMIDPGAQEIFSRSKLCFFWGVYSSAAEIMFSGDI